MYDGHGVSCDDCPTTFAADWSGIRRLPSGIFHWRVIDGRRHAEGTARSMREAAHDFSVAARWAACS